MSCVGFGNCKKKVPAGKFYKIFDAEFTTRKQSPPTITNDKLQFYLSIRIKQTSSDLGILCRRVHLMTHKICGEQQTKTKNFFLRFFLLPPMLISWFYCLHDINDNDWKENYNLREFKSLKHFRVAFWEQLINLTDRLTREHRKENVRFNQLLAVNVMQFRCYLANQIIFRLFLFWIRFWFWLVIDRESKVIAQQQSRI